jgi:hypothetical protein
LSLWPFLFLFSVFPGEAEAAEDKIPAVAGMENTKMNFCTGRRSIAGLFVALREKEKQVFTLPESPLLDEAMSFA